MWINKSVRLQCNNSQHSNSSPKSPVQKRTLVFGIVCFRSEKTRKIPAAENWCWKVKSCPDPPLMSPCGRKRANVRMSEPNKHTNFLVSQKEYRATLSKHLWNETSHLLILIYWPWILAIRRDTQDIQCNLTAWADAAFFATCPLWSLWLFCPFATAQGQKSHRLQSGHVAKNELQRHQGSQCLQRIVHDGCRRYYLRSEETHKKFSET